MQQPLRLQVQKYVHDLDREIPDFRFCQCRALDYHIFETTILVVVENEDVAALIFHVMQASHNVLMDDLPTHSNLHIAEMILIAF